MDRQGRKLLVLDIDETLVFASEHALDRPADLRVAGYHVYKRPHLDAFLDYAFATFEVGVWTSSGQGYAEPLVAQLMGAHPVAFVWSSARCSTARDWETGHYASEKRLAKLKKLGSRSTRSSGSTTPRANTPRTTATWSAYASSPAIPATTNCPTCPAIWPTSIGHPASAPWRSATGGSNCCACDPCRSAGCPRRGPVIPHSAHCYRRACSQWSRRLTPSVARKARRKVPACLKPMASAAASTPISPRRTRRAACFSRTCVPNCIGVQP